MFDHRVEQEAEQITLPVHEVLDEECLARAEEEHGNVFEREVCIHLDQPEGEQDRQPASAAVASPLPTDSTPS